MSFVISTYNLRHLQKSWYHHTSDTTRDRVIEAIRIEDTSLNDHGYVPLVVSTSQSFPNSRRTTGFVTRLTRRLPLVEQERLTLPEYLRLFPIFCVVCPSIYECWLPLWYLQILLYKDAWWINCQLPWYNVVCMGKCVILLFSRVRSYSLLFIEWQERREVWFVLSQSIWFNTFIKIKNGVSDWVIVA